MMRCKLALSATLSFTVLAACDKLEVDDVQLSGANQAACTEQAEDEPHPYLSCDPATHEAPDPECSIGCGYMTNGQGEGHMICAIPCEQADDCEFAAGESQAACIDHRCYYFCDDEHACPAGLECVNEVTFDPASLDPDDPVPSSECMAPFSEAP